MVPVRAMLALLLAAPALTHVRFATPTRPPLVRMQQPAAAPIRMQQPAAPPSTLQALTFPCLSLAVAASGLAFPRACAPLGTLPALQAGMSALMLSMGLSLTPADLRRALASPREIVLNAALCFGAMPLVAAAHAAEEDEARGGGGRQAERVRERDGHERHRAKAQRGVEHNFARRGQRAAQIGRRQRQAHREHQN